MSSTYNNWPIVPIGTSMPSTSSSVSDFPGWSRNISLAIMHAYRVLASAINDRLGAGGSALLITPTVLAQSFTIPPNASAVVGDGLTLASGVNLDIAAGGNLTIV